VHPNQDTLLAYWQIMLRGESDSVQRVASLKVKEILSQSFTTTQCLSLKLPKEIRLSALMPTDSAFLLITPVSHAFPGGYFYDGLLVAKNTPDSKLSVYPLKDKSDEIKNPETLITRPENWYGALYYQLLEFKSEKGKFYVLLGWDGGNGRIQRKIIEVLSFDDDHLPRFGDKIFDQSPKTRLIFEYASGSYFVLRYEKQHYRKKVWYKRKAVIKEEAMIVVNRLVYEPTVGANVAAANILDAYLFSDGKLILLKDIDARNPEEQNRPSPKNPPSQGLIPPD